MDKNRNKIPDGWRECQIKDVCGVLIGGTPARNKPGYWDEKKQTNNIWVSIRDLSSIAGKYINDSSEYISDEGVENSNVKLIPTNTVLMSFKLSIGKVAITKRELFTNEAIAAFIVKDKNLVDYKYLYYILPILNYDTDNAVKGATLNKEKLLTTKILLPPLEQQNKIAEILGSVDEEIDRVNSVIENSENLKDGVMGQLFTKGIGHKKFKKTKLGEVPDNWQIKKGLEISSLITKGASPNWQGYKYQDSGMLFVTSENVRSGYLDLKIKKFLSIEFHNKLNNSKLKKNDLLINIVGASIARSCKYDSEIKDANINQAVCLFRTNNIVNSEFILQYLQLPRTINRLLDSQDGSARQNLSLSDIKNFLFVIPPLEEQKNISSILLNFDNKISINKKIKDHLILLKKGLLFNFLKEPTPLNI